MATIAAVYTGFGLDNIVKGLFKEILPEHRLINIVDDAIIHSAIAEGRVTPNIYQRLMLHYKAAALSGADIILNTCSSVGRVAESARPFFEMPIVRIDQAMAERAVQSNTRIGVIATLNTTLNPTIELLEAEAALKKRTVEIIPGLADGAYLALVDGKPELHDDMLLKKARTMAEGCDAIVLAQGSMSRMEQALRDETGITVYSSPRLCLEKLKAQL